MGDEHQPLRGSFIRRESSGVIQGDDSFEWVPYGCRLVHPVSASSAVKVLKTTFDDTASQPQAFNNSMTDDNSQHQEDLNVPAMEPSTISEGKDVKAADEDGVPIEEMSILLIGDSFVRSLMEALIQNIVNVGGRDVLRRKNSTSWLGTRRKPLRYTSKTIVFDVQRRLNGGRVRIRLQYQFDPLLYHLGNMTASAHPSAALSSQHLQAYPNRHQPSQRFSYKAGILGPEVPSFLPSLQEHQFDVILFSPGHWPASGKPVGGHWTTDQLLVQLKSVIDSLKEYERLRAEEHERQRKEEHRYYRYFSRMYGGVPASRPHTDSLVKESEDWRNNYRLAYWSSLAERLMAHHGIFTLDSFGIVLPDANMANEGIRTISREAR
ncbi:hypothetical protein BGW42_006586 [Actinomortierella wolfii]|nr:hypothetical protein BGW42_006586 [Actinomortierella wolfii]